MDENRLNGDTLALIAMIVMGILAYLLFMAKALVEVGS